jgi:hypothetical protein
LALLSQRSRWSLAATRNPLLRPPLRLPTRPLLLPQRLLMRLHRRLRRLTRLHRRLRLLTRLHRRLRRLTRRTDPTGSGMKARADRNPVCAGFRVSVV